MSSTNRPGAVEVTIAPLRRGVVLLRPPTTFVFENPRWLSIDEIKRGLSVLLASQGDQIDVANVPPPHPRQTNLSRSELEVLSALSEAWNKWIALDDKHPDDNPEMKQAIHSAQLLVAARVARRADPGVWNTLAPDEEPPTLSSQQT